MSSVWRVESRRVRHTSIAYLIEKLSSVWRVGSRRVRRALENTAKPVGGDAPDAKLTYGCGLLQVSGSRLAKLQSI